MSVTRTPRRSSGASIGDVARLAGVSAQTVSRVATGSQQVREETRSRVLIAMEQLGYTPNRAARALRSGRYGEIGLLAQNFHRTGESMVMHAIVDAAQREGYSIGLITAAGTSTRDWNSAVRLLPSRAIDALIVIRAEALDPELLALPRHLPVVINGSWPGAGNTVVGLDQIASMKLGVEHLLALGHRTVHHLSGPANSHVTQMREAGWRTTLTAHGIAAPAPLRGDWTPASGYHAGLEIADRDDITAVCVANDEMALGVLQALQQRGRRVPDDISVVGFDDIDLAAYALPPLTTVRQNFTKVGETAVRMVVDRLHGRSGGPEVTLTGELIVRDSTAAPSQRS